MFDCDTLIDVVRADAEARESAHDMGGNIIPAFASTPGGAGAFHLTSNEVPGRPIDRGYLA